MRRQDGIGRRSGLNEGERESDEQGKQSSILSVRRAEKIIGEKALPPEKSEKSGSISLEFQE